MVEQHRERKEKLDFLKEIEIKKIGKVKWDAKEVSREIKDIRREIKMRTEINDEKREKITQELT